MKYQFIGRTTDLKGKTLWEILANLKNFGVGRLVIRNRFQRYPEVCYMKILKVAALPPPVNEIRPTHKNVIEERRCIALCDRIFRGKKFDNPIQIDVASYKADYQLIPKDEEYKFLEATTREEDRILARTMEQPPLMRELAIRAMKAKGLPVTKNPEMEIYYNTKKMPIKRYRIAKEGEKPTVQPTIGLGTPASPSLYDNLEPI